MYRKYDIIPIAKGYYKYMDEKKYKKAIITAVIGNILEWYDFVLYAFFAFYISKNFFIDSGSLVKTFIVFGAAFIARPLGAFLLGAYGDKFGRKNALIVTITIMALGTAFIGLAPTYDNIGIIAPFFLLIGRLLQGFSAGGEIGSATAFLLEYAPKNKKSFFTSLFQSCMGLAGVLGSLIGFIITYIFTNEQILNFAWRIPFIAGLVILPVGIYLRKSIDETPEFKKFMEEKVKCTPLKDIFTKYKKTLSIGISFSLLWTVSPYTFVMFIPSYFMKSGFAKNDVFIASLLANMCMVFISPIMGKLADRHGIKKILYISILLMMFGNFIFINGFFMEKTLLTAVITHSGFLILISLFIGVAPSFVSRIFPLHVRASGVSISYNIAAVMTGFTPAFLSSITNSYPYAPALHVGFFALVALAAVYFSKIKE